MPDVSHSDINTLKISKTHVPTTFKWNNWGSNVELAGSFDSPYIPWEKIQMKRIESQFEVTLDLQPNKTYDYKFVVDGDWVCDPNRPKYPDSTGCNENHQIYVEAPKITSPPLSPTDSPTTCEQEIEEFNLKDDELENQHDVKPEQQSTADEVEETIEEIEEKIEQEIVYKQEIEEHNIINEQETEEQKFVNEQEIEEQKFVYEHEQETEEQKFVNEQEIEEQKFVNEQETEEQKFFNEQEIEEHDEQINIFNEQEIEEHDEQINTFNEQETDAAVEKADEINNITKETKENPIEAEKPVEKQEIIEEPPIEKVYVERKELKEDKEIIEESETDVISNVFEETILKADVISNVLEEETTLKSDVSLSLQTKTLENDIEEKSVDSGVVESVVKTVVESVVESSDIPHTDKITNSLQPSQIIKEEKTMFIPEEIGTSKIIINETTSEIQVEELNLPNEPITETEVPSTTEASSIIEVPSVTEVSGDLIDKKVNEETTLPALDLTVAISNATIIDNNNTDNTSHKDEIIGEKVEPHESLPEMLVSNVILEKSEKEFVSTSDLMTENIIVEKEFIVQELEENPMKETETFKERKVIDHVISDTNEILPRSIEEVHKEYETVQDQTLPRVFEASPLTQQSPPIDSSISEVSEIPKESLTTTYEQISTQPENLKISHNITEQKVEEFVQDNVENELDTNDDGDTIVEKNLSSIKIIQESTEFHEKSNDISEENVEKLIPIQDEGIFMEYDDWEVQIAENNTTDITHDDLEVQIAKNNTTDITLKSVDGTQANEQMPSPDEYPDHEPEIEFFAETRFKNEIGKSTWSEIKGLSVSTHEETISEEKLQGIDEINEVHEHMMDNKSELERSLNSHTTYENEEQSSDHHDNPTKMDNEAFIIDTETNHTENLNKVDEIYTISYDNIDSVGEIQNNLSISQKDFMTEDTKESLDKITTDNNLSDNLSDEAPGSSATACTTTTTTTTTTATTIFNSPNDDKSDFYSIPDEMNTAEEIKPISKSTNGRKRSMTIFSPGESTKDVNMVKSKHSKKHSKIPSSREVVTKKKLETQKYEDNDVKGNIFYLIASLVTTFTLGIISMLIKVVSGNRR